MLFDAQHTRLHKALACPKGQMLGPQLLELRGGLPGPNRRALVVDRFLDALPGESRAAFERRIIAFANESDAATHARRCRWPVLVVFGALPPLPGANTMFGVPPGAMPPAGYWGADVETGT
jgi:hypothetical protein